MKPTVILTTILLLVSSVLYSQDIHYPSAKERNKNKPLLFEKHADSSDVHPNFFNAVASVDLGDLVTIQVMQQMVFKGKVHIAHETENYRTVSIESEETPGLRLILSHTSDNKYYGIIGCVRHKDVLTLRLNEKTKKYQWIKKEIADVIPD